MWAIVKNNRIEGFTEKPDSLVGVEVFPIPPNWDGNPEKLEYREGKVVVISEEEYKAKKEKELREVFQKQLKSLEFDRLQKVLDQYGYKDLGDVQYWHSQDPKDEEPAGLLMWYKAYDDAIWNEIDSLSGKSFEELQNYDPVAVEQKIFNQTKDKLPPMED